MFTASNGLDGVEKYSEHKDEIDLVLSDVGLPKLHGTEVFKRIREMNPKAKVAIASGYVEPNNRSQMFKAGVKEIINKPYDPNGVLVKVRGFSTKMTDKGLQRLHEKRIVVHRR